MAQTIIFDLGGVLVHLDWDKVCAPLAELSGQSYTDVMAEVQMDQGNALVRAVLTRTTQSNKKSPRRLGRGLFRFVQVRLDADRVVVSDHRLRCNESAQGLHRPYLSPPRDVLDLVFFRVPPF